MGGKIGSVTSAPAYASPTATYDVVQPDRARQEAGAGHLPALDGLRGLMTLFVMVSHYFGEVPHGPSVFCVGWIAVHMFFVLSGFLVGRLVIRKRAAGNFLPVFFLRRATRTLPIYILCCLLIVMLLAGPGMDGQVDGSPSLPIWSYFALVQNVFVILHGSAGHAWLAPTWTLAVEEQFYLLAPWLFLLAPRRAWIPILSTIVVGGSVCRAWLVMKGTIAVAPLALLPTCADVLSVGLLLAVLIEERLIAWQRWSLMIRTVPVACLFAIFLIQRTPSGTPAFQIFGPLVLAVGCAVFILTLVFQAPEARRFHAPVLFFLSRISYAIYLTHLAVLGIAHGAVFGTTPDIVTPGQWAVTIAAMPVTIAVSWALTKVVEEPITAWGRSFAWREPGVRRPTLLVLVGCRARRRARP